VNLPKLGGLYIGARPDLRPNPIEDNLGLQLGLHFVKFGSTIGSLDLKPLYPIEDPILNDEMNFEPIGYMIRSQVISNLDPIPLSWPKGLAPFLCHVV
jgi:hypothetical protein